MVPQALGYAALAGVPVQAGLYAIPLALIVYAIFGSSPQLIVGPVSTVSVLTGSIVVAQGVTDPSEAVAIAAGLAILSGIFLVLAGAFRIGWAAEFLSKPIITGFVFGLSISIVVGEIPVLLGLSRGRGSFFDRVEGIARAVDEIHPATTLVAALALLTLFLGSVWSDRVPWGLFVVVIALIAARVLDLADIAVIGAVPSGLPRLAVPDLGLSEYRDLVASAGGLALVGLAETLSAGRLFAIRNRYRIRADQEFVATGMSNIVAGLSGGIGVGGSLSKTATADESGARSQLTGFLAAIMVVLVLVFFASSLNDLPQAVLSAIVIKAVWGLMDVAALARFARVRRNDFIAAMAALIGVLVLGTLPGLLLAIAQSVLGLVYRSGRLQVEPLGKVKGEKAAWGSLDRDPKHETIDGILVLRLTAPLFWVNSARATALILDRVETAPPLRAVIVSLEATNQLDITAADELGSLIRRLRRRNVDVYLVRVMHPARQVLEKTGVIDELGVDHMWRTISHGVRAARSASADE